VNHLRGTVTVDQLDQVMIGLEGCLTSVTRHRLEEDAAKRIDSIGSYCSLTIVGQFLTLRRYLDRLSRASVRCWLHLPHDVPQALFHAYVKEGGHGLPEVLVPVPLMRRAIAEKPFNRATWDRDPVMATVIGMSKSLKSERARFRDGVKSYSQNVTN